MRAEERARIEERRRRLVGDVLAAGAANETIEATFRTRFGRFFGQTQFWDAFESACIALKNRQPWHMMRQLMLSFSLPQEINAKDDWGETMLTLATTFGRADVVSILCQVKAKPSIENAKGWSSVHIAAAYNHVSVLEAFVTLGISVDDPGSRLGYTPVHLAASVDNVDVLQFLHDAKQADFTKIAANGYSVLHVAAENGSTRCVRFLTQHYPDLQHVYDRVLHENPAHKAAKALHLHVYRELAVAGSRTDLENVEGDSALALSSFTERYNY